MRSARLFKGYWNRWYEMRGFNEEMTNVIMSIYEDPITVITSAKGTTE
jgi:hypothetical protein